MTPRRTTASAFLLIALVALAGAGCTKAMRKARLLSRANDDFAALNYDKAEIEYLEALRIPPLDPVSVGQIGIIYLDEGRTIDSYKYLRKAAQLDPANINLLFKLGLAQLALGDVKDAEDSAKKVLEAQPGNQDAWLVLTSLARNAKVAEDAGQLLESLRQKNPDQAAFHIAQGMLDRVHQDLPGARKEFQAALDLDPKSAAANLEMGDIMLFSHDPVQADLFYRKAAELSPLRSVRRVDYIEFKIRNGAVDEAKKMLADLNRDAPDYIPAWVTGMKLAFAEQRYDDCTEIIQKILARDASNFDALMQRGDLKLALGDSDGAVQDFQKLDGIYRRVPQLKLQLAAAQMRNGDPAAAENALGQALAISPNFDPAILLLAEINIRKGNPAEAVSVLSQLIRDKPNTTRAYTLLAEAYQTEKKPDQALAVYGQLSALQPKNPQIPLLAGVVWEQEKRLDRARQAFEAAIQIEPDYGPAQEKLVDLDLAQKQYTAATDRVDALIRQYPKAAAAWVLRAKIRMAQRDLAGAESDLLKAIDMDPKLQTAYMMLTRIYVYTNKYQQAVDKLTALAAQTNSVTALMQLGLLQFDLKHYDDARAAYERLLAVDPKYAPALNNLAYIYCEKLGRIDRAYDVAQRARSVAPDDPATADTLGWVLFRKGEYHNAIELLQECVDKLPADSEAQYHLGMAHYMLGEEALARVAFEHAVAGGADFPSKDETLRRLALLKFNGPTADPAMVAELEKSVADQPNDPVALVRLAELEKRSGSMEKAADHYQAALKLNPRDVRVMLELAQIYSGPLKNPSKAREMAKSAHATRPRRRQDFGNPGTHALPDGRLQVVPDAARAGFQGQLRGTRAHLRSRQGLLQRRPDFGRRIHSPGVAAGRVRLRGAGRGRPPCFDDFSVQEPDRCAGGTSRGQEDPRYRTGLPARPDGDRTRPGTAGESGGGGPKLRKDPGPIP